MLVRAAELRDVGLIAVPDEIVASASRSTRPNGRSSDSTRSRASGSSARRRGMRPVARLVRSAHERYDGAAFPTACAARRSRSAPASSRLRALRRRSEHGLGARGGVRPAMLEARALCARYCLLRELARACSLRLRALRVGHAWSVSLRPCRDWANFISVFISGDMASQHAQDS